MKKQVNFTIGFENYNNTLWHSTFYPDDLPSDWEFDYYTNEYSCLMMSEKQLTLMGKEIETFVSEISDSFSDEFTLFLPLVYKEKFTSLFALQELDLDDSEMEIKFYQALEQNFEPTLNDSNFFNLRYAIYEEQMLIRIELISELEPKQLKILAETCLQLNESLYGNDVYVFFADSKDAIKNASQLNLLMQML